MMKSNLSFLIILLLVMVSSQSCNNQQLSNEDCNPEKCAHPEIALEEFTAKLEADCRHNNVYEIVLSNNDNSSDLCDVSLKCYKFIKDNYDSTLLDDCEKTVWRFKRRNK